ncbi:MAG: hypothetical protein AAGA85_14260 [Bacteroidota bacterium]
MGQGKAGPADVEACDTYAFVDFGTTLRPWDGFGVNYVEMAQTFDYVNAPQDYGGFSILSEVQRQEIIELIFGEEGLQPDLIKMFLDPLHQQTPGATFEHAAMTQWMRYFVSEGLERSAARNQPLEIITTLYGPPGWAKKQRDIGGRDPDEAQFDNMARYMVSWIEYLRQEGFPVRYASINNESANQYSWDVNGAGFKGIDYDAYWTPEQVAEFMTVLRTHLDQEGLEQVGVTPGETANWSTFHQKNYSWAIVKDPEALKAMDLITSHSFGAMNVVTSSGISLLRSAKPELHAWVTSHSWGKVDMHMSDQIVNNINKAKVNAIIPWAVSQRPAVWRNFDPNPAAPIQVLEDSTYEVNANYYFYKQYTRAGKGGKVVCPVSSTAGSGVHLLAFGQGSSDEPDAFVVVNLNDWSTKQLAIRVIGSAKKYRAVRSSRKYGYQLIEKYEEAGSYEVQDGYLLYTVPRHSVTTFFAEGG